MLIRQKNKAFELILNTARKDDDFKRAHAKLDSMVLEYSTTYVPFESGVLRASGHIPEMGIVEWNTPYAHYMYEGVQYIDPKLGVSGVFDSDWGWWSHKGEAKVKTDRPLTYKEQGTGDHWFENAKADHLQDWLRELTAICGNSYTLGGN